MNVLSDHREGSSSAETPLFQMVGDGESTDDITVPLVFLFSKEGATLTAALQEHHNVDILLLPKEKQLGKGILYQTKTAVYGLHSYFVDFLSQKIN